MDSIRTENWSYTRDIKALNQMGNSGEELTKASEKLGNICSLVSASKSQNGQSGEGSDIECYSEYETNASSSSSSFKSASTVCFDQMSSTSDDDSDRVGNLGSGKHLLTDLHSVTTQQKKFSVHQEPSGSSFGRVHSSRINSSEDLKETHQSIEACDPPHNIASPQFLPEISSPERPFLRPPSATAKELIEIHRNYRRAASQEWPILLPPNMDEDLQNLDHTDPTKRPRYLPLAPPYHLLPNTLFFRKTSIKPPPTYCSDGLPPLKRIINRYLASILVDHMKGEEELRIFLQKKRKLVLNNFQAKLKEMKEEEEADLEGEGAMQDDYPVEVQNRQERRCRVILQHLLYGGQLLHYIQDDGEPPSIPGYFNSSPLIPSNVRITRELCGTGLAEYQQERATRGLCFLPIEILREDRCTDPAPSLPEFPASPRGTSPEKDRSPEELDAPDLVNEFVDIGGCDAVPDYNVVATERYASISITPTSLNLQFAERRLSICRSPRQG